MGWRRSPTQLPWNGATSILGQWKKFIWPPDDPSITLPVIVNVIRNRNWILTFAMGLTRKRRRPADPNATKLRGQGCSPDCDVETELCAAAVCQRKLKRALLPCRIITSRATKSGLQLPYPPIFTEGTYMSSGQLIFPQAVKMTKNSSRRRLLHVISGSFRVPKSARKFRDRPRRISSTSPCQLLYDNARRHRRRVKGRLFFYHCKDNAE